MKRNIKLDSDRFACFADIRQINPNQFLAFNSIQNSGKDISREQMSMLASCSILKTIDSHAEEAENNQRQQS